MTNSFWDTQTSNQSESDGGEGRTTAQMRLVATFTGWDFDEVWSNVCNGWHYPTLQWQNLYTSVTQCPNYVAPVEETPQRGGSSTTGRVAETFVVPNPDVNQGNRQEMRVADRVEFEARHTSDRQINTHRLTLNRFTTEIADVTIQSDPIRMVINRSINYTVDLDSDGIDDILVRYDGIENGRAVIFIQEIVREEEVVAVEEPITEEQPVVEEVTPEVVAEDVQEQQPPQWMALLLAIVLILAVLWFVIATKKRKKRE